MPGEEFRRFIHDCESCVFLGVFVPPTGDEFSANRASYDLYFCGYAGNVPTVIARYGDDGPAYCSAPPGWHRIPALEEATQRAHQRGLLAD
jgi:hypothetical protein